MTDQTPATEAGRRLAARLAALNPGWIMADILAIEAEASADTYSLDDVSHAYSKGQGDALREAAERVSALDWRGRPTLRSAVLAILHAEATP